VAPAWRTVILQPATSGGGQPGPQRKKGVPRPLFWVVLSFFLVSLLVIAGLVVTRPAAGTAVALRAPASGTSLFAQQSVQTTDASVVNGVVAIGTTACPNSIGYTCNTGVYSPSTVVYDVAGYTFLNATLGVPSNATNAAGSSMSVTFFKDGSTDQLGKTLTISLDNPVALHLNLAGASQLSIDCAATQNAGQTPAAMDLASGNAVLAKA
jgi:hypothetical protein